MIDPDFVMTQKLQAAPFRDGSDIYSTVRIQHEQILKYLKVQKSDNPEKQISYSQGKLL